MAKINDHLDLYKDVFIPPEGYKTDYVEFATYSLSLKFLMCIPALIYAGEEYRDKVTDYNVYQLMKESKFKDDGYCKKFHVFYDKNAKPMPNSEIGFFRTEYSVLAANLLCSRSTSVDCDPGLFHPKFILLQFKNDNDNSIKFRLIILSRNLTFAHYYETGVVLESIDQDASECKDNGIGDKIATMITKHYGSNYNGISLNILSKAKFVVKPQSSQDVPCEIDLFFASQLKDQTSNLLNEIKKSVKNYNRCNIVSMNPTNGLIEKIIPPQNIPEIRYICNFSDLYRDAKPEEKPQYFYRKDNANKETQFFLIKKNCAGNCDIKPEHIHSKMYIFWNSNETAVANKEYWKGTVFVGSANCSDNGLKGNNEELLLKMKFNDSDEDLSTPTKNISAGTTAHDAETTYHSCSADKIKKDSIDIGEICEDEFPRLNYKIFNIKAEQNSNIVTIKFTIKNKEQCPIWVKYSRGKTDFRIEAKKQEEITFQIFKRSYSNIIFLRKDEETRYYLHPLACTWQGEELNTILDSLPIDIPQDLKQLVPYIKGGDTAYERLRQHCLYNGQNLDKILSNVSTKINDIISRENNLKTFSSIINKYIKTHSEDELNENCIDSMEDCLQELNRIEKLKNMGLDQLKIFADTLK